jgi:hypothetical protein
VLLSIPFLEIWVLKEELLSIISHLILQIWEQSAVVYDQKKGDERTNNDLQNTTQKTKDGATRTQLVAHVVLLLLHTQLLLK